ncbi:hypothetical protein PR202_ga28673 [Eleusine coracana subsp. coracana]|uniref:RRM domain-containing protein n=1 Tax=Eleusine coracana subsp. coracana TaxID=191504 RepID=A0AAV5DJV6_ELECO|nr:hypothetical protein PR202_ga28673 [Eleusine coracana subsp. coracana]
MAQESSVDVVAAKCTTTRPAAEDDGAAAVAPPPATPFKFNVHAPEFVPMSPPAASPMASPMSAPAGSYYSPFMQMHPGGMGADWNFFTDHEPVFFMPEFAQAKFGAAATAAAVGSNSAQGKVTGAAADVAQKIVKQIVSDDGKKVRRRQPFTEKHKEELQSRMIIVENLPADSSRNSLEKIFGVVGSVKNIKICHPQEPSSARASKSDTLVSNKMHALVEYETLQQAEKAVEKLNDERNWRKGLRVRTVLRRSPKSVMRLKRPDFDHFVGSDDDSPHSQMSTDSPTPDHSPEAHHEDHQNGSKKGWARGRGKLHVMAPHSPQSAPAGMVGHFDPSSPRATSQQKCPSSPSRQASQKCPFSPRQPPQGPRMPDGTRGFTMGRGKPPASPTSRAVTAPAPVLV